MTDAFNTSEPLSPTPRLRADRPLILQIVLIFISAMLVASIALWPLLQYETKRHGQDALTLLEAFIDQNARRLKPLIQQQQLDCGDAVVTRLRREVFRFPYVKEIGLYDQAFRIYCASNDGSVAIRLPAGLRSRLVNASNNQTLSLSQAKISDTRALFFYLHDPLSGRGANVLLPPESLLKVIEPQLQETQAFFQINVIDRPIQLVQLPAGASLVAEYRFQSSRYPLVVTISQTLSCQLGFLLRYSWVGLLLGSFVSLLFIYMRHQRLKRNSLSQALIQAIENRELYVCYQPVINYKTGQPVGFEALLRWQHPEQGDISPTIFVPLAEQLDMIVPLTERVLDDVTRLITWHGVQLGDCYISVNISRQHLLKHNLAAMMQQRCYDHPGLERYLLLEVTENCEFSEGQMCRAIEQFERLQCLGFRLAVDDFGTGYAGLDFIRRYSFDVLKIDRAFVVGLGSETAAKPLLEAMIQLAHQLDMSIIAEGVELPHQAHLLDELGIESMQGFLFAEPMRPGALLSWLEQCNPILEVQAQSETRDDLLLPS